MLKLTFPGRGAACGAVSVYQSRLNLFCSVLIAAVLFAGPLDAQNPSVDNALIRSSSQVEKGSATKTFLKNLVPAPIGPGGGQIGILAVGPNADTISTVPPFIPNNGQSGVTLEFIANQPVDITGMGAVFDNGITSGNVWVRTGGVAGPPTIDAANGWTQVVTGATVTGANGAAVAYMDFGATKISVPANTRIGLFVEGGLDYMNGSAGDQVIHTDGVATVDVSDYASYGGTVPNPTFNPRRFCGAVVYELAVSGNCTPFTNFAIGNLTGTSADITWTSGAGNTSFYLEYGPTGFTPGSGTMITGTIPGAQPPVLLTGLSPQTTYDVYFGEICNSGGDTAKFPAPQVFTTTRLCPPPAALAGNNVTSSSVDLSWTHPGGAPVFNVIYGPPGFDPATGGTTAMAFGSPYTLTGLAANTGYDIYLAAACGIPNGNSDTIGPISILTLCGAVTAPYFQDFETGFPAGGFGPGINPCFNSQNTAITRWEAEDATGANENSSGTGPFFDKTMFGTAGGHYLFLECSGTSNTSDTLYSDIIDVSGLTNPFFGFSYHMYGADMGTLEVEVWDGNTWVNIFAVTGQQQTAGGDPWIDFSAVLPSLATTNIQFRFIGIRGSNFASDMSIDDMFVIEAPSCAASTSLMVSNITNSSADLSWLPGGGTTFNVEYGPMGFTPGSGTTMSVAGTPYTLPGLSPFTGYDVYLQDNCGANGLSTQIGPVSFTTLANSVSIPYTEDFESGHGNWLADNSVNGTWEHGMPANTIINQAASGSNAWVTDLDGSYNNSELSSVTSPPVDISSATGKEVFRASIWWNSEFSWDGTQLLYSVDGGTTWMVLGAVGDPNNWYNDPAINGLPAGQQMGWTGRNSTANGSGGWVSAKHEIDSATLVNNAQIIFRFLFGADGTANDEGFAFDDIFVGVEACPNPTNLTAANVTPTSADIQWTDPSGAKQWELSYGAPGFSAGSGTQVMAGTNPYSLTGLTSNTSYEVYVRALCGVGSSSIWTGPLALMTPCNAFSTPFMESFDGTSRPGCWSESATSGGPWSFTPGGFNTSGCPAATDHTGNGGNFAWMDQSSTDAGVILESPEIDVSGLTQPYLEFFYWMCGNGYTPPNITIVEFWNGSAWVVWDSIQRGTSGWEKISGDIMPNMIYGFGLVKFRFRAESGGSSSDFYGDNAIDDVKVIEAPSCVSSSGVMATNVTTNSADISWTPGGGASFNLEYGPSGFTPGAGTTMSGVTNPYTLTGLMDNTAYDVYITDDCGGGSLSVAAGPASFTTLPAPPPLPTPLNCTSGNPTVVFTEEFASVGGWTGDIGTSNGNWEIPGGPTSTNTGPDNEHSGPAGSFMSYEASGTTANSGSAVSPAIDLSAGTSDAELSFWMHAYGASIGTLTVGVGTSAAGPFTTVFTWVGQYQTSGSDPWVNVGVDLTPYLGQTIYLQFFQEDSIGAGSGFDGDIAIDLIEVSTCLSCAIPGSLTNSNLTSTSVDAGWTENGTATQWQLSIGPAGFTPGSGTQVVTGNNPLAVTGLMPITTYDWYVRAICGPGDTSAWSAVSTFTTPIQGPSGVSCTNGVPTMVFSDEFDDPNTWSGDIAGSGNGVWRYNSGGTGSSGTGPSAAHSGSNYIFFEGSTGGLDTASFFSGPIDLSCVSGAAELSFWLHAYGADMGALDVRVATSAGGPYTTIFNYPGGTLQTGNSDPWQQVGVDLSAYIGQTIYLEFRIRRLGSGFTTDMAIDLVQVESCVSCPLPSMPVASNIGTTTADLSWQGGGAAAWQVEYGPVGFAPGSGTVVSTNNPNLSLTNLMIGTAYEYYVRSDCGSGDYSCWVGPAPFTTALCDSADRCEFYFYLEDDFGDGWNGASVTVYQAGVPVAVLGTNFNSGSSYGPDTLLLCDSLPTMLVLTTEGNYPEEVIVSVRNPLGVPVGSHSASGSTAEGDTLISFISDCDYCPTDSVYMPVQICEGDSVMAGGAYQTMSGLYVDMYTNMFGCDSIVYTDLMVIPITYAYKQDSICEGDSAWIGGFWVTNPGTYFEVYQGANGCDSICVIDLNIMLIDSVQKSLEICDGDSAWIAGAYQKTSGTYYEIYTGSNGCDSICVIDLLVKPHVYHTDDASVCDGDSIFLGGAWQKVSGSYTDVFPASNGCDSIVTTVLTVFPKHNTSDATSICEGDSALINGSYESSAGMYSKTFANIYNCDSTHTVTLTVIPISTVQKKDSICAGDSTMIAGMWRSMAGVYCDTLTGSNGCDSICCTTLSIMPAYSTTGIDDICDGDSIFLGGAWQTTAGNYCDTLTASNGCDSIHCTLLSVLNGTTIYITDSICDGDSVYLAGAWRFTSGIYCDSITSPNGCMGVYCTDLSVLPTDSVYKTDSICANDSIWIGGEWRTMAGIYTDTLTNMYGCDSICYVDLSILPVDYMTKADSICMGDSIYLGGAWQTMAGTYYDTYINMYGCDSICATVLIVKPVDMVSKSDSICMGDSLYIGGAWQTMSGMYYDTLTNMYGCDSICITHLTVLPSYSGTASMSICPGDSAYLGGAWQSMAGMYTDVYTSSKGCDSTVVTTLALDSTGCTYDCNGDLNGSAYIDGCGSCVGGNTGLLPCVPGCNPNEIKSLSLIDASNASVVKVLVDGDTIDKSVLSMFSVRADTCGSLFGSVLFEVNGVPFARENVWPYAIKGGNPNNYFPWNPVVGTYHVSATPYTMANATGVAGTARAVTIHIVDTMPTLDCNGDLGGTAYVDSCGVCVGGNTGKTACVTGCATLEVVSFDLVSSTTGMAMRPLNDGDTIYLGSIGGFTIRANTCDGVVGSVVFDLNGSQFKKENLFPYDIMGGNFSSPVAFMPPVGTHTVVATPYGGRNGNGMMGIAETVTFHVMGGMAPRSTNDGTSDPQDQVSQQNDPGSAVGMTNEALPGIKVFPNPTDGEATIALINVKDDQLVVILDASGKAFAHLQPVSYRQGQQFYSVDLSNAPKGIYLIQVNTGDKVLSKRLIVN